MKKKSNTFLILLYALSAMSIFCILTTIQFLGQPRDVAVKLAGTKWTLIGLFMIIVETLNQVEFYLSEKKPKLYKLKGWIILFFFFVFSGIYLFYILRLPIVGGYNRIASNISELAVNCLISLCLPFYSFSSKVRFWLLYGNFTFLKKGSHSKKN